MPARSSLRRRAGALLVALTAATAIVAIAPPSAHAEDRRDWRRERHDRDWRWHHEHPYAYAPPPVVYAPPVAAPSLNFVFPLHIR